MRAVVQRVSSAKVTVDDRVTGEIGAGLLVLLGVEQGDGPPDLQYITAKIRDLRIFADAAGKMNLSVLDTSGAVLVVSQFTLSGDARNGRRPSFATAAPPQIARIEGQWAARGDWRVPGDDASRAGQRRPGHDSSR
jgi:D-tyrosyl-tRNA(Tyr) deacylase